MIKILLFTCLLAVALAVPHHSAGHQHDHEEAKPAEPAAAEPAKPQESEPAKPAEAAKPAAEDHKEKEAEPAKPEADSVKKEDHKEVPVIPVEHAAEHHAEHKPNHS